jgi:hypothetical protein
MSGAAKLFLSIIILLTFLPSSFAQQSTNSPSATRSVVVNVFDAHGNVIPDLTRDNFRARLNGKPVAVLEARYNLAPRRIVVLLDMSGSITGGKRTEKWQIAREAVDDLLLQTPGDVPIAMLTFAGSIRDVFDFPNSRIAIAKWLKEGPSQQPKLKGSSGRTALFDAILEGVKLLNVVQPGDAIYAITDGGENASHASDVKTRATLLQSGVRLFAFLFAEPHRTPVDGDGYDSFLKMVDDSGGFAFGLAGRPELVAASRGFVYAYDADNREKVKAYTKELSGQINGFWTLQLATPSSSKESKVKLEVVGPEGKKGVGLIYPRVLPAPE